MKRLLATMQCDVRLQFRNGFFYAVAFVLVCWAIVLTQLPEIDWAWLLPPLVFGNLVMVSFYFIGGLVLLEKGEGTLEAQVVTPLRSSEFLASKIATLTLLSLAENLLIVACAVGLRFRVLPMAVGIALASLIYALVGFVAVSRYQSINEYIMPSVPYVLLLSVPYLQYFELWQSPVLFLHPLQGSLVLMRSAFEAPHAWQWFYGVGSSMIWILVAFAWSQRVFERFIVAGEGGR